MKIKGHTEIQLTNVKTGEVKTYHDDNMMTNGLAEFLKNHGMLCGTPFTDAVKNDLVNTLLGGILLFDSTLTESASNTRLPDGVKMTANAAQGVTHTGDPSELGSYDANESGWQNAAHTVYRHVFTWTTSQGNGRIAAACLTSKPHGYIGEGNGTSKAKTTDNTITRDLYGNSNNVGNREYGFGQFLFAIDDNEAYYLSADLTDQTLTISKAHITDTECDLRDVASFRDMQLETVATLTNPTGSAALVALNQVSCRILSGSVVIAINAANNVVKVLTLASDMQSITSYVDVTAAATSITFHPDDQFFLSSDATKLIMYNVTAHKMYKIALSNLANVSEITINGAPTFEAYNREYLSNGKRHYAGDYVYDETLDVVNPMNMPPMANVSTGDIYKDNASLISYMSAYNRGQGYALRNNDYLATINNLSSAVTKDSTQTMKVIYTLTFAS